MIRRKMKTVSLKSLDLRLQLALDVAGAVRVREVAARRVGVGVPEVPGGHHL